MLLLLIFILFFTVGALGLNINLSRYERANLGGRNYDVSAKITNIKESETGCYLTLSNAEIKGNRTGKLYYKIALSVYGKIDLEIGDIVSFNANLCDKTYKFEDRFNANDIERKIKYTASISADEIIKTGEQRNLFEQVRIFIKNALKTGLDEKEFPVGLALLTGDSSFIDNELISSYRYAGVAHIFAVSGLHIGFLAGVLIFIFKKIKIPDLLKTIIIGLVKAFFGIFGIDWNVQGWASEGRTVLFFTLLQVVIPTITGVIIFDPITGDSKKYSIDKITIVETGVDFERFHLSKNTDCSFYHFLFYMNPQISLCE